MPRNIKKDIMKYRDIEVMAPVGSYESLMAAINAGAGSVYFGVEGLNMRSRSSHNFTLEDLKKICSIASEANVNTYLTLNTVIFGNELERVRATVEAAKLSNITAIIASDMAVIQICRELNVPVHISTQANITNYEAVKFYANFSDVVVLAREMTLDRVKEVHDNIVLDNLTGPSGKLIRIEMFVHGALCMAVSGKCYLSLHEKDSSANRGACMQVCRKSYKVTDLETGSDLEIDNKYIMSPRDLKTIHFLNKLLDAGVSLLKIEGRARSPEYVKSTVECYREAANAYVDGTFTEDKIEAWNSKLGRIFNRGFWDGYYLGQRLGEWSSNYGSEATTRKVYVGKCTNFFKKVGVAEFKVEAKEFYLGDEYIISGPTTGIIEGTSEEIRVDLKPVEQASKGEEFSIKVEDTVRRGDKIYKVIEYVGKSK